ncbi:MAG: elongation factor G [Verrucomicrobia bacterium]|nr:elongation factor G [Verrucomicrobiota bacterium]
MKTFLSKDIRNFAIVGHASAGKTMLSECMLACAGVINRLGSVAAGSTVSDYHADEKDRKISIHASLLHAEWLDKKFNIIDTPGYLDFISEGLGALRVADFALVVVNAFHGIGVGTDQVWKYATQYGIPKVIVINGLDKEHVDFEASLQLIRARFGDRAFPLAIPVNAGPGFNQVLDVMRSEVITYQTDGSGKYSEEPAAGDHKARVSQLHSQLIEFIAESDDSLLEKFFAQGGLSEEEMRAGVHQAVQKQSFIPVFCTSAETNVGVARLMDFIAKYGSSPVDRAKIEAIDANDSPISIALEHPEPVLYVFKTMSEAQFGELSFFRLYAGSVRVGQDLYNSDRKITERFGQIYALNGKNRVSAESLNAGDIGATVKLKDTHTGNTLCNSKNPVTLLKVQYPKPNIHAALRLKSKGEEDKIATGLSALHEEDQTFLYKVDSELHQTVISGQGELHLQVIAARLRSRFRVDFDLIEPKVPYRETIKGRGESKYRHKKQTGGAGQFAEVWMRIEPKERDSGIEFTESLTGQNVDRTFVPSVEKGVAAAAREGILAGYRIVDLKVDFYDGKMHPVDSKDIAFQIAGKEAFKEAFLAARPCMLEPICVVEIRMPDECMGNVIGDLSSRRGKILGMDSADGMQIVRANVPQKELYQYSTVLRSLTGGRGLHTEDFSHYEEMPKELEAKVVAESKKAKEETAQA